MRHWDRPCGERSRFRKPMRLILALALMASGWPANVACNAARANTLGPERRKLVAFARRHKII
mgnify:CR=1 FL=1